MEDKVISYTADQGNVEVITFDDASSTVKVSVITSLVQIGQGLIPGGKKGQVYTKKSDADFDADWEDNLATGVEGIKGSAESGYSQGFYEITPRKIGLGNVDNTSDKDKPISDAQAAVNAQVEAAISDINVEGERIASSLNSHISNTSNPHNVTKEQIGLGSVDNTPDIDKPVSTAQAAAIQALQTNVNTQVNDIKAVIPSQASADNKLTDRNTVRSIVGIAFQDLGPLIIRVSDWSVSTEDISPFVYRATVSVSVGITIARNSPIFISFDDAAKSAGIVAQSIEGEQSPLQITFYASQLPSEDIKGVVGGIGGLDVA